MPVQAEVWRNQVCVYQTYPWRLLQILHSSTTHEKRLELIGEFKTAKACDIDMGFTATLRNWVGDQPAGTLCNPSSNFMQALILLALSKASNIEVECNFSRAAAARNYTRGSSHSCATMSSKHLLAELCHQHSMQHCNKFPTKPARTCQRGRKGLLRGGVFAKYSRHVVGHLKAIRDGKSGTGPPPSRVEQEGKKKPARTNGWVLFRTFRLKSRPARLGETKQQRLDRVIAEAAADYRNPAFHAEKQYFSALAKDVNKEAKITECAERADQAPATVLDLIAAEGAGHGQPEHSVGSRGWSQKHGPWGVSDVEWPLGLEKLQEAVKSNKGFVKSFASKWRANRSLPMKASVAVEEAVEASKGVRDDVSFCMKLGGCFWRSSDVQQENILRNIDLFKNVLRFMRRGVTKRAGGDASSAGIAPLPLLVLAPSKGSAADPEVFLLCKPQFRALVFQFSEIVLHQIIIIMMMTYQYAS